MNSLDPTPSNRPTKVEVPKELSKVSMVNTSLKKLKHHLAGFDAIVKERTSATAIAEGTWGFEHTKACFRDEIIQFVKALKDIFNTFDQYLIDELTEVQNVFHQMEQSVEQYRLVSKTFEIKMNLVLNENERLLEQIITKDIMNIVGNSSVDNATVNMHECKECLKLETELHNKKDFIEKETYDKLFRRYTMLEKHCISLELDTQLNQEIFQTENSVTNQSAPSFDQYFELNELKAQSQENDTFISKLKERIKSLSGNIDKDKVKKDIEEIETINIELDHRVSKLIAENEHLKQTYKQLYDSIKSTREQGLIIAALKDELRKLKEKAIVDNTVTTHTIDPKMLKVDVKPIAPRLINNRTVHSDYLWLTQEQAAILREVVGSSKTHCINRFTFSTIVDQDAPSPSNSQTTPKTQNPIISNDVEEDNHDLDVAHMHNDPFYGVAASPKTPTFCNDPLHESLHDDSTSQGSSSNMRQTHTLFKSVGRWTKYHPIANVIDDPSRSISTRKQLQTDAMWCFFDAFLTLVEPKNFKKAMTEPSWIDAMQTKIHEFERLEV
nr:integrase, catalytic region, zinc finger, CCHC-type, peptidase aspartic, catalytic [Tanacetum cinerariifolium]